jgi:hypothetical protein
MPLTAIPSSILLEHSKPEVRTALGHSAPTSSELYDFFNSFMGRWLGLPSSRVTQADDDIQFLPNEQGLLFSAPMDGILVLRTSEDFGKGLQRLARERQVDHDLFMEMLVVMWHKFVSRFWELDSRRLPAAFFKRSLPMHWPDRKPDSALLVFVLNQPVEVRLWLGLTEAEKERWKIPVTQK